MSETPSTPQEDADRIRLKRLAKLQGASSSSPGASGAVPSTPTPPPQPKPSPRIPVASPSLKRAAETVAPSPVPSIKKKTLLPLDVNAWEHETISHVFHATLDRNVAEKSGYDLVWLKQLATELEAEEPQHTPIRLNGDIVDRLLIARLELDPSKMTDDLEFLPVLASLPPQQTTFEYLVGCWKRFNSARSALVKKAYAPVDVQNALNRLEKVRELIISYTGLTLQEPEMFPQPSGRPLGPPELVAPLLSLSALSAPLLASSSSSPNTLTPSDIDAFLQDLTRRFEPDNEIDDVLGPVVRQLLFHESLFRPEGLGGGDAGWRGVVSGLEALVSIKGIAVMITRMEDWNPPNATAATFERISLLGPLCRLGIFGREWPGIAQAYFSDPDKRTRDDIESSNASLRGTLKSLQSSLFQIFNTLVRASAESREAVLEYFARVVSLNDRRAGMQVEPETVATDSFMVNLQSILLRFAEPFMDANYTKMDRIDPLFYARSKRIDLKDETRIKATSEEASAWAEAQQDPNAPAPNFVSNIFYLAVAMSHYGILHTISTYSDLAKHLDEMQRHVDMLNGDGSWMGSPMQARTEQAINTTKVEMGKIRMQQLAFEAQLLDPELVFRSIGFTNFLSTWLIRQVDPAKKHPNPPANLPLPKEVPMAFRVLPEYILEDIVDYLHFVVQSSPDKFELSGKTELLIFVLTFLNSTWYIKNPFLKSKINDVLFFGIWGYGRERNGLLGNMLNSHPMALKHLMPALTNFYIEVEQTGASSQFYDKFSARRNIAYILKVVWDNPTHREALNAEAARDVEKFVKFVNLMINDVTFLMDESLSDLNSIHNIQQEMDNQAAWNAQPVAHRRDRETQLRTLERHASGYIGLGRSTVELLKIFTAETKAPFMMPEIVDRLAAMLDYNLHALVGPKYRDLEVRDREKLKFNPKVLLSDIIQVFLNLSDQEEFVRAVAGDGRSYTQDLFERAAAMALKRTLKSEQEVQQLRAFVAKVEVCKSLMEAEEDLGEVPDEFLDPLMFTVMRDPVLLPSSRNIVDRSTIKSHLLSDSKDPFNRVALSIDEVIPDTALKARIDAFLIERRNKPAAASAADVPMDTA
ncbi:ubiquitin elongating factor core-domain-containing protein [Mycena rosella]|uniref:RING-type E3 ubiquitin transferase n=1 Tax=Mycena rosella TaxID=1033263 RepID=A0AAD7G711_MYCRO|nr:ubiquitin elongating factor core-domain-containing protein [Mycena rosella]